jgi:hypothetical protein
MKIRLFHFTVIISIFVLCPQIRAQYELKAGNFNSVYAPYTAAGGSAIPAGPPTGSNQATLPTTLNSNFRGMGQTSGASAVLDFTPNDGTPGVIPAAFGDRYPSTPDNAVVLGRSTIGGSFASGVPRFFMGDIITPPLVMADGITPAPQNYWRAKPVAPGELLSLSGGASAPVPAYSVAITSSSTSLKQVTVASVTDGVVVGASVLGQPITAITGNILTLAGNANQTISGNEAVVVTPALSYYYSPHAEKVFASQPGRVSVTWVTLAPVSGHFQVLSETFAVSSNTSSPVRTIYWTEGGFDGPRVQITDSRISTVNPVFYSSVPKAVAQEVTIPGYEPAITTLTTLSFDKYRGVGQLRAYNAEGRIMVEYLGGVRLGSDVFEYLGSEVVDVVRNPDVNYTTAYLGRELQPHDGDASLSASPVIDSSSDSTSYYGTSVRPDGSQAYYAERETSAVNRPDDGNPASSAAYNKVVFYWSEKGAFDIMWPKFQDRYWLRWSPNLSDYAHYTVDEAGSTAATGIQFTDGALPEIVFQDDGTQTEAKVDSLSQRFYVGFAAGSDRVNRSLLKFGDGSENWYVNVYSQAEGRSQQLSSTSQTVAGVTTLTVSSTAGLEVGMVVTGGGISGTATIESIIDSTHAVISQNLPDGTTELTYTVEADGEARIDGAAVVGERLIPPSGHELAGYVSGGSGFYQAGYINPVVSGVEDANRGSIIPVNALPTDRVLTVRWFKKITAPSAGFKDLYIPGKIGRYTVNYPAAAPQIVIAQGARPEAVPGDESVGSIYLQNDPTKPGFNPNEEHAIMIGGRPYALRDDLNIVSGSDYTSEPFALVTYISAVDQRPAIRAYRIQRSDATHDFDYSAVAGTLLVKPYPLPLMPLPMVGSGAGRTAKDVEIVNGDLPTNTALQSDPAYKGFTFKDRKGFTWIHRGPHADGAPTLEMRLYYVSQDGFYIPGLASQPAPGTILPFLRNESRSGQTLNINAIDVGGADEPLAILYHPEWPSNVAELQVGETLTLPKFGLPQVRGQTSAEVVYQQSLALDGTNSLAKGSVTLHDPTREKTVALNDPAIGLDKIPVAIKTSNYQGKIYFQTLPPHLQQRVFVDPLRGPKGTLVFTGVFHDEIAGEDYLDLNLLTAADELLLKGLVPAGGVDESKWHAAIDLLGTLVETFKSDPAKFGNYIPDTTKNKLVGENDLVVVTSSETAVDSYALTATGQGTGYVTMVFGNGSAFTPVGDPVQVKVFKVAEQLYTGDLKVISSSNPLDEQVTLRHSGDFAGKPEDYEFDWRWTTGEASAPAIYSQVMTTRIGDAAAGTNTWTVVRDPGARLASAGQYSDAGIPLAFPRLENVHPVSYVLNTQGLSTDVVVDEESYTADDIAKGYPALSLKSAAPLDFSGGVPERIVFSASMGELDGVILYVNGIPAMTYNVSLDGFPQSGASTGLSSRGLAKQFNVSSGYFSKGANRIELAVYSTADPNSSSSLNFMLEAAEETDLVEVQGSTWDTTLDSKGQLGSSAIVGGAVTNPFGGPQFVLNDRWFTLRYRPKASANNVLGTPWSRWTAPQFNEGWVKRVLAAINPFEQRVKDLYNNSVNTDVSMLTQAGTRWEGDIALTMDNIQDVGLIAIYETVLNRAKDMSIDANTNDPDANNALLLAAGYLNDLYMILGNEAYADAENPTISLDDGLVNTSRFSFEGQVASSLDEELALLRGRDDSVSPGVASAPAYNRLYWNYTKGINSGEAIYATNYNIKEKAGSANADGVLDEADAQNMFPQGHGDAYGHYLTALTGYYRLLRNPNFGWQPRAEAVTVLGQPVTVDFQDERKFAAAASSLARTAKEVCALVFRKSYKDDPATGWGQYRDHAATNSQTEVTRYWGLDEEVSRSTQGALYHWAVANALVPEVDSYHSGIQKIDRTTIPELGELAAAGTSFQSTIDNANARLNPLGLSPGAVAFDISPDELKAGRSHFEQIYDRALKATLNAAGSFNQAALMSRSLRTQQNSIDDYNAAIVAQEAAYLNQLIDIYGRPYSGDVGPGKLYSQGYRGPDLINWFIVDRSSSILGSTEKTFTVNIKESSDYLYASDKDGLSLIADYQNAYAKGEPALVTQYAVTVQPSQYVQYNDVWRSGGLGSRPQTGELQSALQDTQESWLKLDGANGDYQVALAKMIDTGRVFDAMVANHLKRSSLLKASQEEVLALQGVVGRLNTTADTYNALGDMAGNSGEAFSEYFPTVFGLAAADATSSARGGSMLIGFSAKLLFDLSAVANRAIASGAELSILRKEQSLERQMTNLDFSLEEVQFAHEYVNEWRDATAHANDLAQLVLNHQRKLQHVSNVLAKGEGVLAEREVFRQRAAAIVQGYRTKDLTFRVFRNEALEQYRSLFDLASRYTYLAAKSYDYETGLLGTGAGRQVFDKIVASRSLGDLSGGVPQSTTSTLGDAGLAGSMAQLNADFSVAKGRLGINNPDQNGTVFSLRKELFRLLDDPAITSDDDAWQQTLEQHIVSNVLADDDVSLQCRNISRPDGAAVPGLIIPFSTSISVDRNFFGLPLAAGDHFYSPSNFATKVYSVGIAFPGYVGMDAYAAGGSASASSGSGSANALSATPYVYLIPCGSDIMRAPPLGDTDILRAWTVQDQALPLPYNLGANDFNSSQFFSANGTLSETPWIIRKHQAFRAVDDPSYFYGRIPEEFTNRRLVGRSVWNNRWKIVIPGYTLQLDAQDGLNRFAATVDDIKLFFRTYSNSGN